MEASVVKFAGDRSIGTLSIRNAGSTQQWTDYAPACGEITVPEGVEVRLSIDPCVDFDPAVFSEFEPHAFAAFAWVSTSRVSDAAVAHLRHLTGLRGPALWETAIGDEALESIQCLHDLEWLDIGDTKITDEGLVYASALASLDYLTLLNDRVTDKGLVYLQKLPKLRGLDLMKTLVSDAGVEALCKLSRLRRLRIVGTLFTESGYKELKLALPHCQIRFHHPHHV